LPKPIRSIFLYERTPFRKWDGISARNNFNSKEDDMMDSKQLIKELNSLIQLDIDAYGAYGQAISELPIPPIQERLDQFREDHKTHVTVLSNFVRNLKGTPPNFSPDIKGFLIKGMTAIRSKSGPEGALKAMETNEKLTNESYSKAVRWDAPNDIKMVLEKNYSDERTHLAFIKDALSRRLWEEREHPSAIAS
jgi:uncharacterized protein (TIGR02284 family)